MEDSILTGITNASLGGGLAVIGFFAYKSFQLWVQRKSNGGLPETRIKKLEDFKYLAENNHFTELEALQRTVEKMRKEFNDYRLTMENRLTRLETKILNGNK